MIVVTVMNRQLLQCFAGEFPRTTSANPGIHFQRPRAITLVPLLRCKPGPCDDLIEFVRVFF